MPATIKLCYQLECTNDHMPTQHASQELLEIAMSYHCCVWHSPWYECASRWSTSYHPSVLPDGPPLIIRVCFQMVHLLSSECASRWSTSYHPSVLPDGPPLIIRVCFQMVHFLSFECASRWSTSYMLTWVSISTLLAQTAQRIIKICYHLLLIG